MKIHKMLLDFILKCQFKRLLFAGLLILFSTCLLAQREKNFSQLSAKDGLSSNSVNDILKDHTGIMWFATDDGLNKFDGLHFTIYRNIPNDKHSLPFNEILALHEDKKGNLWIGTSGGSLSLYNRKLENFYTFPATNTPTTLRNNVVTNVSSDFEGKIWAATYIGINIIDPVSLKVVEFIPPDNKPFTEVTTTLYEDSKQCMWIGTTNGLYFYDPISNIFKKYSHITSFEPGTGGNVIQSVIEDKSGKIWIATNAGLCNLVPETNNFSNYYNGTDKSLSLLNNFIITIAFDNEDKLWVGSDNGLGILNKSGELIPYYTNPRITHSISVNNIQSIYFDRDNICWIGTYRGGINIFDKNLTIFNLVKSNPFDEKSLPASIVTSFASAVNGNIYVGTDPGGLCLFDPVSRFVKRIPLQSKKQIPGKDLVITSLLVTNQEELIIGTWGHGLFFYNQSTGSYSQMVKADQWNSLSSDEINCIKKDQFGNKWVGTNGAGVIVLDPDNNIIDRYLPEPKFEGDKKLPINGYIDDILEDRLGNIWIGTHGGGMARLNPRTKQFTLYTQANSNLPSDKVSTLFLDRKGNVWAGTLGGGMLMYNPQSNNFTNWSEKDTLVNNNIFRIIEDQQGLLWITTNNGMSSFNPVTKRFTNYNHRNGLQNNSFSKGAGLITEDGTIYFGGLEGFNFFEPNMHVTNKNIPTVIFTDLKIANQTVKPSKDGAIVENISIAKEINLDYKQSFSLSFIGLNFTLPELNQYAYFLEGYDSDWNLAGNNNTVSYTNLDPGTYKLRVKASNNDGLWNTQEKSIDIIVHPPFWRSIYAYILYFLLAGASLLFMRFRGIEKIRNQYLLEQEKMKVEQERRDAERIHALDLLKIKFLTNLSHEFRTPISLILGPIDSLIEKERNEDAASKMNMIRRNARRLLNLVNQLLDFRKLEDQELKLALSHGELISFIQDVADSFKDLSERKKIELNFTSEVSELHTRFDHGKLERILFNLLSNAFKFTLEGGHINIEVQQVTEEDDDSVVWMKICVSDNGIGIPFEKQERIFEHFFQVEDHSSIINQGSGIGLSIAKEFSELLGGTIDVESQPDKGSIFTLQLPFVVYEHALVEPINNEPIFNNVDETILENEDVIIEEAKPLTALHQLPTVLLVEDNEDFRNYLKDNLKLHYTVLEAANGKDGWQKALARHPQLIISDISMPVMDGIELCKKIKTDKRTKHIPVILLTALTGEQDHLKGLATGANDYITKPFNFDVLNVKVKNLLELNDVLKTTYSKQIKVATKEVTKTSDDDRLMQEVMKYIEDNLNDIKLSVETLSRHIGMSRSSLYTKLLELTGETPVEFIRSVKLEKAVELMKKTDMNIAQIAYSVGFSSPNYFAKSFKAKYNMLPSEYIASEKKTK